MIIILALLLLTLIVLEGSVTTVPLVLLYLILLTVFTSKHVVFGVAFGAGILIDLLLVRPIGQTSAFYLLFLFFIVLYERKYEMATVPYVLATSLVGTISYGLIYGLPSLPLIIISGVGMSVVSFLVIKRFSPVKRKHGHYQL